MLLAVLTEDDDYRLAHDCRYPGWGYRDLLDRIAMNRRYDAVLFDLLTALLDSWTLWNAVAGSDDAGRRWRTEYLRITYGTGGYRAYDDLVGEAAEAVGLSRGLADQLAARYGEITPWPEVHGVLASLRQAGIALGVVTNCSEALGRIAAARVGVPLTVVITAERAGHYKPDPAPYQLAVRELGLGPDRCLFVAGSAYDLFGTARVGLPTWWHDRVGLALPPGAPLPLARHNTLTPLVADVLGA
jgi:2-haloalkanoic acid dehalogenase type II